jgi:molecular chaperone DnaK
MSLLHHGKGHDPVESPGMGSRLLAQCETAKIALCSGAKNDYLAFVRDYARVEGAARNLQVEITRTDLERECESLIRRGLGHIDRLLEETRLDRADVHLCLPTGGMVNMPAIRNGLVERFGGRVPNLQNGDRIISEGAAWIAHDNLRLTLAKPIEVRVADGSGSGHYVVLVPKGLALPVENQVVAAANRQFVCADPRDGFAAFEFVKPMAVGLVSDDAERETLCIVNVEVNPNTSPLMERLHCEISIDHDYVAHVHVSSRGREAETRAEFHRLDFGLAIPPDGSANAKSPLMDDRLPSPGLARSARIVGLKGSVAMRPNIVPEDSENARHSVAGDLAYRIWPGMFNPDRPEASARQREEHLYYTPCSKCGRKLFQIEQEGPLPICPPGICYQKRPVRKEPYGRPARI